VSTISCSQLTAEKLRQAYALFPTGVVALCGLMGDRPIGITVSSFTSVSLDPPLVSACVAHTSTTWPSLRSISVLGISVLASDHSAIARSLASKNGDRFTAVDWFARSDGAVFIRGAALWLKCSLAQEIHAGDHCIALLEVSSIEAFPEIAPMVFHHSTFGTISVLNASNGP
jgi:flavin reductase (DIM6/NTAB) family NADH-FMN oxidoreductase RutF